MGRFMQVYAKVNLFLRVLDRRSDGYHNILSLMAHINLADLLKLEYAEVNTDPRDLCIEIKSSGGTFVDILKTLDEKDNLITRAMEEAAAVSGCGGTFRFLLEKNIPAGAGLGGGSGDAAGALKLAGPMMGLDEAALHEIASKIGADVPFHLNQGFSLCEGIGEVIEPLGERLQCTLLVVNDGIHVDTGKAYRMLKRDKTHSLSDNEIQFLKENLRNIIKSGDLSRLQRIAVNDFENVVFKEYSNIALTKEKVIGAGAEFAMMTGSGSTVIGLFSSRKKAEEAAKTLKKSIKHIFLTDFA